MKIENDLAVLPSHDMANYNRIKKGKLMQSHIAITAKGNWNPEK